MRITPPRANDIVVDGLRLRLWDHGGDGGLPVILCLHGALDTGRSFDALAADLHGRVRVLALDMRGHGQSAAVGAGGSYHLQDFLKDAAVVIDTLTKQGRAIDVLVGHSMGANIALLLAGAWPERVRRLLLVDGVGPPPEEASEQPGRLGALLDSLLEQKRPFKPVASVDDAVARVRTWNPGVSEQGARRMVEPVLVRNDDGTLGFPFDPRTRGPTPVRHPEEMWDALCRRVTATTTILRASDGFVPGGDGDEPLGAPFAQRARLLRADVVVVDGPHHLHVEQPDAIADAVTRLLART